LTVEGEASEQCLGAGEEKKVPGRERKPVPGWNPENIGGDWHRTVF